MRQMPMPVSQTITKGTILLSTIDVFRYLVMAAAAATVAWSVYVLGLEIWCWAYGLLYY